MCLGAAGPGVNQGRNGVSAVAKWKLAKGLQECDRARGHLMGGDIVRAGTAPLTGSAAVADKAGCCLGSSTDQPG